jgi:hypothetical protein
MRTLAILLSGALLAWPFSARCDDAPRPYAIKREAWTGTNIPRTEARAHLPFDKRYEELTDEQRREFKLLYEEMADGDEPPFPELGLGALYGPIADGAQKVRTQGALSLFVYVASDGAATKVEVLSSPSPEITRLAALVAMKTRFKPGKCGGSPCAMVFPVRATFEQR